MMTASDIWEYAFERYYELMEHRRIDFVWFLACDEPGYIRYTLARFAQRGYA